MSILAEKAKPPKPQLLNDASSRLWRVHSLRAGLDEILAAPIELLGADMSNIQLLDTKRGVLVITAQRGCGQDFLDFFREVSIDDDSACGRALRAGERTIIEDIETCVRKHLHRSKILPRCLVRYR